MIIRRSEAHLLGILKPLGETSGETVALLLRWKCLPVNPVSHHLSVNLLTAEVSPMQAAFRRWFSSCG